MRTQGKKVTQVEIPKSLFGVKWRKSWLYPFLWSIAIAFILMPIESMISEFFIGHLSSVVFFFSKSHYTNKTEIFTEE